MIIVMIVKENLYFFMICFIPLHLLSHKKRILGIIYFFSLILHVFPHLEIVRFSITYILSSFFICSTLLDTKIMVVFLPICNKFSITLFCVFSSKADKVSSKILTSLKLYKFLAILIRCFCPPDKRFPSSFKYVFVPDLISFKSFVKSAPFYCFFHFFLSYILIHCNIFFNICI